VRAVGGKADLHIYADLPHGFANHPEIQPAMMTMIGGFFRRWAIAPEVFAQPAQQPERAAVPAA